MRLADKEVWISGGSPTISVEEILSYYEDAIIIISFYDDIIHVNTTPPEDT